METSAALATIPKPGDLTTQTISAAMRAIIPTSQVHRDEYRRDFTDRLHRQFFDWLKPDWQRVFIEASNLQGLVCQFDAFVIELAEPCGEEIALADSVMHRLIEWGNMGDDGMELLTRYHESILKGHRRARAKDCETLTRRHKKARPILISEFKMLRKRIQIFQRQKRRPVVFNDLRTIIGPDRDPFPMIVENFGRLEEFSQNEPKPVEQFLAGVMSPGIFTTHWMAWHSNRSYTSLPNDLCEVT